MDFLKKVGKSLQEFGEQGYINYRAKSLLNDSRSRYDARQRLEKMMRDEPDRARSLISSLEYFAGIETGEKSDLAAELAEYGKTLL